MMIIGIAWVVDLLEKISERRFILQGQADGEAQLVRFGYIEERVQMKSGNCWRHVTVQKLATRGLLRINRPGRQLHCQSENKGNERGIFEKCPFTIKVSLQRIAVR